MIRQLSRTTCAIQRVFRGDGRVGAPLRCFFVTAQPQTDNDDEEQLLSPKQPFVTSKLEPGEWDVHRKDPFFRPPPSKQARLTSAEDFANRPPVAFDGEFSTYSDAMITLSWLDQKTCRAIYKLYVDMISRSEEQHAVTSHEYVARVIAQTFSIAPWRAAGIIQLQHAEEQLRATRPELLCDEQARYAEETILQNIRDAYRAERSQVPNVPFVEDPVGIHGQGEPDESSTQWANADDVFDLEQKLAQAKQRDTELARILIDDHIYRPDEDETQQLVPTDGTVKSLLKQHAQLLSKQRADDTPSSSSIPFPKTNARGDPQRRRWKFVAQVVSTRNLKKGHKKSKSYTNNNSYNTVVEQDGDLRVATLEEAKQVAWKPARAGQEYILAGARNAWLEKKLYGKTNVWGEVSKDVSPPVTTTNAKDFTEPEMEGNDDEDYPTDYTTSTFMSNAYENYFKDEENKGDEEEEEKSIAGEDAFDDEESVTPENSEEEEDDDDDDKSNMGEDTLDDEALLTPENSEEQGDEEKSNAGEVTVDDEESEVRVQTEEEDDNTK